jgi:hypothetical protein
MAQWYKATIKFRGYNIEGGKYDKEGWTPVGYVSDGPKRWRTPQVYSRIEVAGLDQNYGLVVNGSNGIQCDITVM